MKLQSAVLSWCGLHLLEETPMLFPDQLRQTALGNLYLYQSRTWWWNAGECKAGLIGQTKCNQICSRQISKKVSWCQWLYDFYTSMYRSNTTPQICPSGAIYIFTGRKPCIPNHLSKRWLRRELPDRLHKVLVRATIPCQYGTQKWDDCEWVLFV